MQIKLAFPIVWLCDLPDIVEKMGKLPPPGKVGNCGKQGLKRLGMIFNTVIQANQFILAEKTVLGPNDVGGIVRVMVGQADRNHTKHFGFSLFVVDIDVQHRIDRLDTFKVNCVAENHLPLGTREGSLGKPGEIAGPDIEQLEPFFP